MKRRGEWGQATVLLVGITAAALTGALILGGVARGLDERGDQQGAADLAALAAARYMSDAYPHVLEPAVVNGTANELHLARASYEATARRVGELTASRNGAHSATVSFPGGGGSLAPTLVRVSIGDDIVVLGGRRIAAGVSADAELVLAQAPGGGAAPNSGEYPGPYAYRSGKPMRPDTALAYDRMAVAARAAGIVLLVVSGYRSDAEQSALFAAHPDPKWVAPPGKSLHRLGTELDLGPPSAYGWLIANAPRFGFVRRYAWEEWHFGLISNAGSASLGYTADRRSSAPSFIPEAIAPAIGRAAQRWNVGASLLGAQLYVNDGHHTAASIDTQAHRMRDLLRRFGSVPLALAAYHAGPRAVAACGCVPAIHETRAYVTAILALLRAAGDPAGAPVAGVQARLVR